MSKIIGRCKRCGSCCLYGEAIEYDAYKHGGAIIFSLKKVHKKKRRKIRPCTKLIYDIETREAICTVFDARPSVCRQYPYRKEELIFESCGFSIEGGR